MMFYNRFIAVFSGFIVSSNDEIESKENNHVLLIISKIEQGHVLRGKLRTSMNRYIEQVWIDI